MSTLSSTETTDMANDYVNGFDAAYSAGTDKKRTREDRGGEEDADTANDLTNVNATAYNPDNAKKRPKLERPRGECEEESIDGGSRNVPHFMPPECNQLSTDVLITDESLETIRPALENDGLDESERMNYYSSVKRPTSTTFWRDGQLVKLNGGEDGHSTDYKVNSVFRSIAEVLKRILQGQTKITAIRRKAGELAEDIRQYESPSPHCRQNRCSYVVSAVKTLLSALDTTKGYKKVVVNQLDPLSCCLTANELKGVCFFNGFGTLSVHRYLECRFAISIKLIFLGNMQIERYLDSENGDNELQIIELSSHFGHYFYDCLENIYNVCFETLRSEVDRRKREIAANRAVMANYKHGDLSSLLRLGGSTGFGSLTDMAESDDTNDFFRGLKQLQRRDNIRIIGTSGKAFGNSSRGNADTRLRYISCDPVRRTVIESPPKEYDEALFISSHLRFRISPDGDVFMDVYTRNALRLGSAGEEENND